MGDGRRAVIGVRTAEFQFAGTCLDDARRSRTVENRARHFGVIVIVIRIIGAIRIVVHKKWCDPQNGDGMGF